MTSLYTPGIPAGSTMHLILSANRKDLVLFADHSKTVICTVSMTGKANSCTVVYYRKTGWNYKDSVHHRYG